MIPNEYHETIKNIDIDAVSTSCNYDPWIKTLADCYRTTIESVQCFFGETISRTSLTDFYRQNNEKHLEHFLACMIWGYGAPEPANAAHYGPYRVNCMLEAGVESVLGCVSVKDEDSVKDSYNLFREGRGNAFNQLGPSYFTKHLYFLGKAKKVDFMPVIFDTRVAAGIVHLNCHTRGMKSNFLKTVPKEGAGQYLDYLEYIDKCAKKIGCSPDQVELFFFNIEQ